MVAGLSRGRKAAARWRLLLVSATALVALALPGAYATSAPAAESLYIVQLSEPPLALYGGGIAGLAPTMPAARGETRLNPSSAASVAYLGHLASRQDAVKSAIDAAVGRAVTVKFRYRAAYNGMAVSLTPSEAERVASLAGVKRVQPDATRQLLTDAGPAWIGAGAIHDGSATGTGTKGEGMVAGIIDTGINHDHPSFADVGGDGFNHPTQVRHYGACAPVNPALCNDKLIGMYDFTGTTPFDDNAHGSHTASTVAGNVHSATLNAPTISHTRTISGVAPHAHIISYKACNSLPAPAGGCVVSATVMSIDQATLDQVDVINFSIGGASRNPWTDPNAIAFLGANAAGVFSSVSAGNSGPGSATIGSPSDAPWVMSVGASTHDRNLPSQLVGMAGGAAAPPAAITGKSVASGTGATPAPIIYAGAPPHNAPLCGAGAADPVTGASASNPFPAGSLTGKIVLCERGVYGRVAKGQNVKAAGGLGMVLMNDAPNGDSLIADGHVLPAVHISFAKGEVLKAWLAGGTGHVARITGMTEDKAAANGDATASFSSRGPNPSVPGVIKPDVTAPGVDIFAAFNTPLTTVGPTTPEYGIISGTSMSSPHSAGAAVLLRALKPGWTPNQVKSALMTTGFTSLPGNGAEVHGVLKEDAATAADPFDMGGGRVELRRAARAGLLFDVNPLAYQSADPAFGGSPRTLNIASLANENCQATCTWTRTVTSAAAGSVTWTAATTAPTGATLSVSPATFTLSSGQSQVLTITATNTGLPPNAWRFGAITLSPSVGSVPATRLPVALRATGVSIETCVIPDETIVTDPPGDQIAGTGSHDIQSLKVSGLYPRLGESANPNIRWTLKVASLAGDLPRNTTWRISWTAGTPARNWFVHMNTFQPTGVAFQYGEVTTTATTLGSADDGSFTPDGTIKITIAASKVGGGQVGQTLTAVNARVATLVGAAGTGATANNDLTGNGTYTLRDCGSNPTGPAAVDDTATTAEGTAVTVNVLANDTHPQNQTLTVSSATDPPHGGAVVNANGTITYTPDAAFSGIDTFEYTVRDSAGQTDIGSVAVTVAALCPTGTFTDDLEGGAEPGWEVDTAANGLGPASPAWAVGDDPNAKSPSNSWFSDATTLDLKDDRLVMPAVDLTGSSRLLFWHRYRFEEGFDGGVLEVSTDDGTTWTDVVEAGGSFIHGGYDGTIDATFGSAIAGRSAWTGGFLDAVLTPMTQVSVDVGSLAGSDVLFRFRLVTDPLAPLAQPGHGWWIDDVEVTETGLSCNEPPDAVNDAAEVDQGNAITIDVLANDSDPDGDPLTIESFTQGADGAVSNDGGQLVYTHDGSSTAPDSFTYTVSDGRGGTASATVAITVLSPADTIESIIADLEEQIEGDRGRSDKLEDVVDKLEAALDELGKTPPARQAAMGAIEGAVGELDASVSSGYLEDDLGAAFMNRVTGAARQLTVTAIDAAVARGGTAGKIDDARRALAEGDTLRAGGSYKAAVNKYKDALAKAEGA